MRHPKQSSYWATVSKDGFPDVPGDAGAWLEGYVLASWQVVFHTTAISSTCIINAELSHLAIAMTIILLVISPILVLI